MKKFLIILAAVVIVFTGCAKNNKEKDITEQNITAEETAKDTESGKSATIVSDDTSVGEYVSYMLTEYVSNGKYYMKQKTTQNGEASITEVAVDGDKTALRDATGTQIIDGMTLYYVIPDQKIVLTSPVADSMKEGYTAIINVKTEEEAKNSLTQTGEEVIEGNKYSYEEYKNREGSVERYYFDSTTIRYIKQIENDGTERLTEILEFSQNIPENFFVIPDGYIVRDLSKIENNN